MHPTLKLAVVGVGRIGVFHARHVQELGRERGDCELVAVVDPYRDTAARTAGRLQQGQEHRIHAFTRVEELRQAGLADGAVIASRTEDHYADARTLIDAGLRVMLEKPLTHSLESAREFAAYLNQDEHKKQALMQAFMRRFDEPLQHVKRLLDQGRIGAPFKIVSVLEDPHPPPVGYHSPGLLADMAVHNVDEAIWLSGSRPEKVSGMGARLYNYKVSSVPEDLDDAFLQMWFPGDLLGQVQVSRNHVAGYRNETWVYGEGGLIHVGHFQENPLQVEFEAYDLQGGIDKQVFPMRDYGGAVPVFIERFGPAYKAELNYFVEQCRRQEPFEVDHEDGLLALVVVEAGSRSLRTRASGMEVEYHLAGDRDHSRRTRKCLD